MDRADPLRTWIAGALAATFVAGSLLWAVASAPRAAAPTPSPSPSSSPTAVASEPAPSPTATPASAHPFVDDALAALDRQVEVDASLRKELASGAYSFDDPLVVLDPYGRSPLTALVLFRSEEPLALSIRVAGVDAPSTVDFAFDGARTEHIVPVYGLYADTTNDVTLTARDAAGRTRTKRLAIATQPLPKTLADTVIVTFLERPADYQPGFNFTYEWNGVKAAYDVHGAYRWYLVGDYLLAGSYDYRGRFLLAKGSGKEGDVVFYEMDPLGRIHRTLYAPYGLHHEAIAFGEHGILATGSCGAMDEDFLYELDAETGRIAATLDLKEVLPRMRTGLSGSKANDWLHVNALAAVPGGSDIVLSARNQSVVARLSWPDGRLRWILAAPTRWPPLFGEYLLDPVGTGLEWNMGQHDPEILPDQDGNPDTMDLLLFDNGNDRILTDESLEAKVLAREPILQEPYSRLVQYRIDERKGTVRQVWQFGKEYGLALYTSGRGSVDLLANGTIHALFFPDSAREHYPDALEITRGGALVWEAVSTSRLPSGVLAEYRQTRREIYGPSANDLGIGTPAVDLIPDAVKPSTP